MEEEGQRPWRDQIDLQSPFVQIEDYVAYSSDAFDACIDVNPDASESQIRDLIADLESEDVFDAVWRKNELYPGSENNGKVPEIIPDRKLGHLVSGNVHPDVPVRGFTDHRTIVNTRSGDHSRFGCFGATEDLGVDGDIAPQDLYNVIWNFCSDVAGAEEKDITVEPHFPHLGV